MSGILGMMVGSGTDFRVTLSSSPDPFSPAIANGTDITAGTATATAIGGTPPYTYAWTDDMVGVSFSDTTTASTTVRSTGTDTEHNGTITCTVQDALGASLAPNFTCNITQGSPP